MRRKSRKFSPMPESRSSSLRNSAIFCTEKYGVMISGRKPLLTATYSMSGSAIRPRTRTEIQTYLEHGSFLYRAQYINEHIIERNFTYDLPISQEFIDKVFEKEIFENKYDNKNVGILLKRIVKEDTKEKSIFQLDFEKIINHFIKGNQKLFNSQTDNSHNKNATSNCFEYLEIKSQEYNNQGKNVAIKKIDRNEDNER